jgi:glycosyltransferase involved in cell wall biosynthesis
MRQALGVPPGQLLVGTVANLRRTKGYPDLLRAAREVVDKVPDVRFVAVGRGPLEAELRASVRELGLDDCFELLGHRRDAVQVMSAFDVFCLPSRHEGLPVVLMEALALGLPIVATDVGGVAELVTDGDDAVLVPASEPARLAAELIALALDPPRRAAMAARARARGELLDAPGSVRTVEAVYREIVAR